MHNMKSHLNKVLLVRWAHLNLITVVHTHTHTLTCTHTHKPLNTHAHKPHTHATEHTHTQPGGYTTDVIRKSRYFESSRLAVCATVLSPYRRAGMG